jgi:hypothetical protein
MALKDVGLLSATIWYWNGKPATPLAEDELAITGMGAVTVRFRLAVPVP